MANDDTCMERREFQSLRWLTAVISVVIAAVEALSRIKAQRFWVSKGIPHCVRNDNFGERTIGRVQSGEQECSPYTGAEARFLGDLTRP